MSVTPAMIKELRDKTGLGLKKCKEALVESGGDVDSAIDALRKAGMASAEKRMGRTTSQGSVFTFISDCGKKGAIVALACETDFVAKTDNFKGFGQRLAQFAAESGVGDAEGLKAASIDGESVEDMIKENISKLGENLNISNAASFTSEGQLYQYIHGEGALLGVMLESDGELSAELGKDIGMHIAASMPLYVKRDDVPADVVAKEKDIYREQMTGKPADVIEKILMGKINKFYQENCLLDQVFVKDDKKSVAKILKEAGSASVKNFSRFQIGA
jgi:elongation factor Ts